MRFSPHSHLRRTRSSAGSNQWEAELCRICLPPRPSLLPPLHSATTATTAATTAATFCIFAAKSSMQSPPVRWCALGLGVIC